MDRGFDTFLPHQICNRQIENIPWIEIFFFFMAAFAMNDFSHCIGTNRINFMGLKIGMCKRFIFIKRIN